MGNSKKRGFMLGRSGRAPKPPLHTAPSGGEVRVAGGRRLGVNLQGATLDIPANWQPDVLLGHDRLLGDGLSSHEPRPGRGTSTVGELHSVGFWSHRLRFFRAAAPKPPEHALSTERTLGTPSAGDVQKQQCVGWPRPQARRGAGTGSFWWTGVKGRAGTERSLMATTVHEQWVQGRALTSATVRCPAAQSNSWDASTPALATVRSSPHERRRNAEGCPSWRTAPLSKTLPRVSDWRPSRGAQAPGGLQSEWQAASIAVDSHMAAARGLTAAALLQKQIAQELKAREEREQEASRAAANDPAAWAAKVRMSATAKAIKQQERVHSLMAALAETETAHAAVNELSAKLQRLGMGHEAVPDDVLDKVQEILSKAGMQPMPGPDSRARKAALQYQLLEAMAEMKDVNEAQVIDTCVFPVKKILEQQQGSVYLIVTLQHGAQCTKNQMVSALKNLGAEVQVADVKSRVSAAPTAAKTKGKGGKPFAPTIEIRIQGGGGLNSGLLDAITNRQLVFTTDEGTRVDGTVTVRSAYALEIHFNAEERSKIKLMWDILELLGLEGNGLNSLLTACARWSLEKKNLATGLMCVRVIEERRYGDVVQGLRPSDISTTPLYGGPLILAYFTTKEDRDRVEAEGALVTCWLGKGAQEYIVLGCGEIKAAATDRVHEVGIKAACTILQERVVAQYAASTQLVQKANNLLTWAMDSSVEQKPLAAAMLKLYLDKECRQGYDITANFVAGVIEAMSKELQVSMAEEQYREALQKYREWLQDAQEEVTRRRSTLGPVTLVRFSKLTTPDMTGQEKRCALGKVFHQEGITNAVENWLRRSLASDGKEFLIAEPVLMQQGRSVSWDRETGVVVAVQDLSQLWKGKIYDNKGEWREAKAQITVQQEVGTKVTVSVSVNIKGKLSRQQVVGAIIKEALQPPVAADEDVAAAIRDLAEKQEGIWVPRYVDDGDGHQRKVIFAAQGLTPVTRMSELPQPEDGQDFHIRSLHKYTGTSEAACESALQVLMQLQKDGVIQPVDVNEQWLLFLPAAYATDVVLGIAEHGTEALVVGESVRDWCVSVATMVFLQQVRLVVRDGLWFPFRMTNTGLVHQHVGSRSENEERQAEERWYNTIGPLCNTALGRTQDTTLIDAAFQSDFNCETPKLVVHTVGQDSSVVLFANSIYREVMTQHPLRVGLPLSATFPTVPQQMLEEFYWWLCAKVQGCLMKWEAHEGVVGKGSEEFVIEHPPTLQILEQQRANGSGSLSLTLLQAQELAGVVNGSLLGARPLIRAAEGTWYYTPEREMRFVWVVTQPNPTTPAKPLHQCHIEWSKNLRLGNGEPNSGRPRGETLYSEVADSWPEMAHGRIVPSMIHELQTRNRLVVLEATTGAMIVLPEVISPRQVISFEQQFGDGTDRADLLDCLNTLTPSMLTNGLEMEQAVARKSAAALQQDVTELLKKTFVWTGVRVQEPKSSCQELQGEKPFGQRLMDGKWLPVTPEAVHASINMDNLARHPAMKDWRGPRRLLLMIARKQAESRPRMIPVGRKGTSILFIPRTSQDSFLTWSYDDPRFRQWQPDGENPLERLARSVLTIENGTISGKQKSSGKQRSREDNEDEDKAAGRKPMNQATEVSGGGGTSEGMDE